MQGKGYRKTCLLSAMLLAGGLTLGLGVQAATPDAAAKARCDKMTGAEKQACMKRLKGTTDENTGTSAGSNSAQPDGSGSSSMGGNSGSSGGSTTTPVPGTGTGTSGGTGGSSSGGTGY